MDEVPIGFRQFQGIDLRVKRAALFTKPSIRPKCCFHFVEQLCDLRDVLQIGSEDRRVSTFRRSGTGLGFRALVVDGNLAPSLARRKCDAAADAFGRAGNQNHTVIERKHCQFILNCGLAMNLDVFRLHASECRLRQASGQIRPAPENAVIELNTPLQAPMMRGLT